MIESQIFLLSKGFSLLPLVPRTNNTGITFRSSDGILFFVHRSNLEAHTEFFPGPDFTDILIDPDEVTVLTEPSEVLAIIFDFVYPRKQPVLETMDFKIVSQVAEAVEKYQIFSAMKVCEVQLIKFAPKHAAMVLAHGIKHDYPSLIKEALTFLARRPLLDVLKKLPVQYHMPWIRYHQAWDQAFKDLIQDCNKTYRYMGGTSGIIPQILIWEAIDNLNTLESTLDEVSANIPDCRHCGNRPDDLKPGERLYMAQAATMCKQRIQALPRFDAF